MSIDFLSAPVTLLLLSVNGLVGILGLYVDPSVVDRYGFRPDRIRDHGEWYRFVTAGFVHVAFWHLAFNLLTLFYFGPELEARLGSGKFFMVFFGSELAAHALTYRARRLEPHYNAIGASGAISGVLFGYCLFEPFSLLYFFGFVPIPAMVFAISFVAVSLWAMKREKMAGIAHEAHVGGALGGLFLTVLLEPSALGTFFRQLGV